MEYTLMHKNVEVADFECERGLLRIEITEVNDVREPGHMPYGTMVEGVADRHEMMDWWRWRTLPRSRDRADPWDGYIWDNAEAYALETMGFSLSDQYWVRPKGSTATWKDGNFFENPFPGDVGDVLFDELEDKEKRYDRETETADIDFRSPDLTTEGDLRKRWVIDGDDRCLLKHGYKPYFQEPYNEVVASKIMDLLEIEHVEYSLIEHNGVFLSTCKDFVTLDTEFINIYRAMQSVKRGAYEDLYPYIVRLCAENGLDIVPFLDRMIAIDYLTMQSDRHLHNFGILRDADTLEWLGPAPIFDCGGSLLFYIPDEEIGYRYPICRPFASSFDGQLELVTSFDWLDVDKLDEIVPIVRSVFTEENGWHRPERTELIIGKLESQIERLRKVVKSR